MKKILNQFGAKPLIKKEAGSLVQQEQVKNRITIIPEFESLIPPLQTDELAQLEANILREGCREPLLVWPTTEGVLNNTEDDTLVYVLIDGHNRYSICQRHGIDFKIVLRELPNRDAVRDFMIDNQLGRRNLTPEQMSYLRGQKYLMLKKKQGRPNSGEGAASAVAVEKDTRRTDEKLADQFNVSPKTIRLDAEFAKGADKIADGLRRDVLSKKNKIRKSDIAKLADRADVTQPIESLQELETVLGLDAQLAVETKSVAAKPKNKKTTSSTETSIQKIKELVLKLDADSSDWQVVCQEIIKLSQQLLAN